MRGDARDAPEIGRDPDERSDEAKRLWSELEPLIRQVIWYVAQRKRIAWDHREDFAQDVHLRMVDGDRSPLLSFKQSCTWRTYLTVVITNLASDRVIAENGKWRASAQARALGPWCERLEQLVHRDEVGLHEAVQIVVFEAKGEVSEREVLGWYGELPARPPWGPPVGDGPLALLPDRSDPQRELQEREWRERMRSIVRRYNAHLRTLPGEDAALIRFRFSDDLTLREIERAVGVPFRRVHERIKKGLKVIRKRLRAEGMGGEDDIDLLIWSIRSRDR